jgi:hypothetical protein
MDAGRALVVACAAVVIAAGCGEKGKPADGESAVRHPGPAEWTPRTYAALAKEVSAGCDKTGVPKLGSDAFGALLDTRNIDAHDKPELPTSERFPRMIELTDPVNQLMKAYFKCGKAGEMLMVGVFFLEAYSRILPKLDEYVDGARRDEVIAGLAEMLMGFFVMLKVPAFEMAQMEPFAPRIGAIAREMGQYLPPDWLPVQLASLKSTAASATDPKHRALLETVIEAAEKL